MTTAGPIHLPERTMHRLGEFATAVAESPTMPAQLEASQSLLEQSTLIRQRLVLAAVDRGMSLAEIGRALSMSPEGARKLRLAALKELER
jgi:predicted transcriptional regulator